MKVLSREVMREARGHGECEGEREVVASCNSQPCDEDCVWGDWQEVTTCSKECGGGVQTLARTVVRNASGLGLTCAGDNTMLGHCNELLCPGVLAAILLPSTLLLILATLSACCFRRRYTSTQETAGTGADSSSGKAVDDN